MAMRIRLKPLALAVVLTCQAYGQLHAQGALPGTPTVINGNATFLRANNGVQVTNSPGAIIHWDSFSVGAGNTARFVQNNAGSAVLNRVTGLGASLIHGNLESNGRVFLLNP
ncbi:MAG: filamentous hemagglutinin N-terminal domain-containing protein, partial [Haliea sp.]